jgi:hypothetical protein
MFFFEENIRVQALIWQLIIELMKDKKGRTLGGTSLSHQ